MVGLALCVPLHFGGVLPDVVTTVVAWKSATVVEWSSVACGSGRHFVWVERASDCSYTRC